MRKILYFFNVRKCTQIPHQNDFFLIDLAYHLRSIAHSTDRGYSFQKE